MLKYLSNYFESMNNRTCFLFTLCLSVFMGVLDYLIGPDLSFSVFYTIPIMLATWYGGKNVGLSIAVVSSVIWLGADLAAGSDYEDMFIPIWNTMVRLAFFVIILKLMLIVHEKLSFEEALADTDPLTGLANRRFFQEQLDREFERSYRYPEPLTVAYLDLDNFKYVNDSLGHNVGDELLIIVSETLTTNIRKSDYVARLGGDEFAIILPMLDRDSTMAMLKKLQAELLEEMKKNKWPVTFSVGVVTFNEVMESSRDMIKKVDDLMYEVKKSGKNNIRHVVWPELMN